MTELTLIHAKNPQKNSRGEQLKIKTTFNIILLVED